MQTKMTGQRTSELVMTAMMMCIIMVAIFLFRIPVPFTQGYVNLSDGIIFMAVILMDRKHSVAAASLGSMLGDIIGGFAMWAPWTFIIKGGMALITALVITAFAKAGITEEKKWVSRTLAMTAGGIFMVLGYFIAERVMYGSWAIAALGLPWNAGQFAVGIVLALCILKALHKTSVIDKDGIL